jgi:hypothetical protein
MNQFTPGPWEVHIEKDGDWALQWPVIISKSGYIVVGTEGLYGDFKTDIANANLISVSPEMFQLLNDVMILGDELISDIYGTEFKERIHQVITKVKGETQ